MNHPNLRDLVEILGAYVDLSSVSVREDSVLGEDIPADSQEMLRALSRIQAKYGVKFTPRDILTMKTMGDLLAVVRRQRDQGIQ